MNIKANFAIVILVALLLSACAAPAPQLTATALPSAAPTVTAPPTAAPSPTPLPTSTVMVIPTAAPEPTGTSKPAGLPTPQGEPLAEWQGVPVMPEAAAGEDGGTGYTFTVQSSAEEVQAFYEEQLAKLGWNLLAVGQGEETGFLMLIFTKGSATLSVTVMPPDDPNGLLQVLLVK